MRRVKRSLPLIVCASLLLGRTALAQQAPPRWGKLRPGPHAVGFKSTWKRDYSRRYDMVFDDGTHYADGKSPRPILINSWYPAGRGDRGAPMRHRGYLEIGTDDAQLSRYASKLVEYQRTIVCQELMGKKPRELSENERRLLEEFWETPTACYRDALPLPGRFPLVIYHSGAQSSYEDNDVLCEFLASHGYVVVGSAYPEGRGRSFNIDGENGSARDFEFLIAHGGRLPNVDWQHIGMAGHSAGAQVSLYFRAHDGSAVDAVVSLDTTQDYYSFSTTGWHTLVNYLLGHVDNMDGPLLMAANDQAIFQLADAMVKADRYYLTTHGLDHGDFIAQGIALRMLRCRTRPDDRSLEAAYLAARAQYQAICERILLFFNAHLKGDAGCRAELTRERAPGDADGSRLPIIHVSRGVAGAEPFRLDSPSPPTPRQIRELMARLGVEPTLALLERYHETRPSAPVFHGDLGFAIVDEFVETGRIRDAIAVNRVYVKFDPENSFSYYKMGINYEKYGLKSRAVGYYSKALMLDPGHTEAADRLRELRESNPPAPAR